MFVYLAVKHPEHPYIPKIGMKVKVTDPSHCGICVTNNHAGFGAIVKIDSEDSFVVRMDEYDEEWYRCRKCAPRV